MKHANKLNALFIIIVGLALVMGCGGDQQAEANKIVAEANKKLDEAKELMNKTESRNTTLFSANIQTVAQLQAYKNKMAGEAKEIVSSYEKIGDMLKGIAKQYDDISRMNVNDTYKEYTKIKSEEFNKRAEAVGIRKGNAQAFVEIDDPKTMTSKFDANNEKATKMFGEADELAEKATKIEKDHADIFKEAK
jgi:hypothetical protein